LSAAHFYFTTAQIVNCTLKYAVPSPHISVVVKRVRLRIAVYNAPVNERMVS